MNLRLSLLSLANKYPLSAENYVELEQLAGLGSPPASLASYARTGIAILGATFGGLGILFLIAANWASLSSMLRFALLEITLGATWFAAWFRPTSRVPLSLLGFLICGGLLADIGQTYQTGADPWQLFALWSILTLPLCLSIRHELLWTAWAVVGLTASLLFSTIVSERTLYHTSMCSWIPAIGIACAFRFASRSIVGSGIWPMRLAIVYAMISMGWVAFHCLTDGYLGLYFVTVISIVILASVFAQRQWFDLFAVSALALGANVVLVASLARQIISGSGTLAGDVFLIGCIALAMLTATVTILMELVRNHKKEIA